MTKKRFKLSMAALGLLAAFFMVLIAVLLAPTLASANKDGGNHHGAPGTGYPNAGPGGGASHGPGQGDDWNAFAPKHDNAHEVPLCADGGVYPCAILGDPGDDGAGGYSDGFENEYGGGGKPHGGDGSPNGGNHYNPTYWGGAPGGGAGGPNGGNGGGPNGGNGGGPNGGNGGGPNGGNGAGPGGGNGPGADNGPDGEKCAKPDEDQSDDSVQGDDETKSCDTDSTSTNLTLVAPDDLPSDFVDPDFGGDGKPKTEGGPNGGPDGENPPVTELAVTEVPEPLTVALFAVGLAGAAGLRRRTRKA